LRRLRTKKKEIGMKKVFLTVAALSLAGTAMAHEQFYATTLSGLNENPTNASPAFGTASG